MGLGRLGQTLTAREIFELVKKDLERVEREISLESVASVDAITTISRYLHDGGGKRNQSRLTSVRLGSPLLIFLALRISRLSAPTCVRKMPDHTGAAAILTPCGITCTTI